MLSSLHLGGGNLTRTDLPVIKERVFDLSSPRYDGFRENESHPKTHDRLGRPQPDVDPAADVLPDGVAFRGPGAVEPMRDNDALAPVTVDQDDVAHLGHC